MKSFFLFISIICLGFQSRADSIPNSSFESWLQSQWFEFPAGWVTNNSQIIAPYVVRDTSPFAGDFAMLMSTHSPVQPEAWAGFPVSQNHSNVGGYCKNWLPPGDSATISVYLYMNQMVVDSGQVALFSGINPNYTQFIVPLTHQSASADSCVIFIRGGLQNQGMVSFDDLTFDMALSVPEQEKQGSLKIYPNPCKDVLTIDLKGPRKPETIFRIYDVAGKMIVQSVMKERKVNVSDLPAGYYLLMTDSGVCAPFVKN